MSVNYNIIENVSAELIKVLEWVRNAHSSQLHNLQNETQNLKKGFLKYDDRFDGLSSFESFEHELYSEQNVERSEIGKSLIKLTLDYFGDKGSGAFLISLNLQIARHHLSSIKDSSLSTGDAIIIFKKCLTTLNLVLNSYHSYMDKPALIKSSATFLCLHQVKKNLPLLFSGIEKNCVFIRVYAANCLETCLDRLWKEVCEPSDLRCSEFLDLMDSALNILDTVIEEPSKSCDKLEELKCIVDEVLCHAMSTAQVASTQNDKQAIIAKAQMILRDLETLRDEAISDDTSRVPWCCREVSDGLCCLERCVNLAVLHLVLHVTSGVSDPPRSLIDACQTNASDLRDPADLDDLISEFDILMDQLMQIGTFAVSCSSNIQKAVEIRSCLASFESLEAELVPSITALYLDVSRNNRVSVRLLLDHWLSETKAFKALLDTIIDPAAFTDVVRSELNTIVAELKSCDSEEKLKIMLKMIKTAKSLIGVICDVQQQESLQNVSLHTLNFEKAIQSCERVHSKLANSSNSMTGEKVLVKAQLLLDTVGSLLECLASHLVDNETTYLSDDEMLDPVMALPPDRDYYKLCPTDVEFTPAPSKLCPTDVEFTPAPNKLCSTPAPSSCPLTPIMARGRLLNKEAVLYNTPKRSTVKKPLIKMTPVQPSAIKKKIMSSVKRSRCFRGPSTPKAHHKEHMDQVNLTDLLEDLSHLDDTFSMGDTVLQAKPNGQIHGRRLVDLFSGWDSLLEGESCILSSKSIVDLTDGANTLDSNNVPTPVRENDLKVVEERIQLLKMQNGKNCDYVTIISID